MITKENFVEEVFSPYQKEIYNFILSRIGYNTERADDLFQEVMYKVWNKRDSYKPAQASIRTWLYRIARNYLIDTYRKKQIEKIDYNEVAELITTQLPKWDSEILAGELIEATSMLAENDREYIQLRYIQELTYSEIAEIIGKKESTVKVATHRAIKKLQEIINE